MVECAGEVHVGLGNGYHGEFWVIHRREDGPQTSRAWTVHETR